jgi:adenylate cyclase
MSPRRYFESAIVCARRAKSLDRLDARGFAELGYAMLYSKQLNGALAEYVQALALNPNDSDIITEYGDALNYAGQAGSRRRAF